MHVALQETDMVYSISHHCLAVIYSFQLNRYLMGCQCSAEPGWEGIMPWHHDALPLLREWVNGNVYQQIKSKYSRSVCVF